MKTLLIRSSAIVLCLLAGVFFYEPQTEAAVPVFEPDPAKCWIAGLDAFCDGTRKGFQANGGASAASCNLALSSLVGQVQMAGCTIIEATVNCTALSDECVGDFPDDPDWL
ncbi:MAG: hypothetical protein AAGM22_09135 [Acidobacteriota bacterium]